MTIESPNSHPIFDPEWAEQRVREHFAPQLAQSDVLLRYGADLLMRAMESAPKTHAHEMIITVLFRQALTAADSGFLALRGGAIDAANVHARRLLEARWSLKLALSDPSRWGLQLHVASLREKRFLASRQVPGTAEYAAHASSRESTQSVEPVTDASIELNRTTLSAVAEILARAELAELSAGFDEGAKALRREPPWHYDSRAPKDKKMASIKQLAKAVGCLHEYETIYRYASYSVHGTDESTDVKRDAGVTAVAPLRTPEGFRPVYMLIASMLVDCQRQIIESYRSGELPLFLRKYTGGWAATMFSTKDVEVQLQNERDGRAT